MLVVTFKDARGIIRIEITLITLITRQLRLSLKADDWNRVVNYCTLRSV